MIQITHLFGCYEQGGVVWHLARPVMNGMRFACARRTVEEQSFFDRKAEFL